MKLIRKSVPVLIFFLFLLTFNTVMGEGALEWVEEPEVLTDTVLKAEDLMQKGAYSQAYNLLEKEPIPEIKEQYSLWLKALALYKIPDLDKALEICLSSMKRGDKNPWIYKIRFLAADIYLKKKDFEKAEKIYQEEATRLLSGNRKEEIAGIYIQFAEKLSYKPRAEELDLPKPNYSKAYSFYKKVLDLEIGLSLKEEVQFKMALMRELSKSYSYAINEYKSYLREFDPDWFEMGSGYTGDSKKVDYKGTHIPEARYRLADSMIKYGSLQNARTEIENLFAYLDNAKGKNQKIPSGDKFYRLAMRRLPATYKFPSPPSDGDMENGIAVIDNFLSKYPEDSSAVTLAWQRVSALKYRGRGDEAIKSAWDFVDQKNFSVPGDETEEEIALREEIGIRESPAEQFDSLQKKAVYLIGEIYYSQKNYEKTIETFSTYTTRFPNGPDWTKAQKGILDSEYQKGVDLITSQNYDQAKKVWEDFLNQHPLDSRSRQILFTFGQMDYEQARKLKEEGNTTEADTYYRRAIAGFQRLVSKYPNTNESSFAQFRIGEILERDQKDLKGALEAYKKVTWGNYRGKAQERVEQMVNKELTLKTEQIYRTNEPALVTLQLRNVKSVTLRAYKLNMADYFHKFHSIRGVEDLDLPLIAPDRTWEVPVTGYQDYLPIEQTIPVPMSGPGVYAVNVAEEEYEATTLLIRSDIDMMIKSSKTEVLVFAQNMVTGQPISDANVLLTDGSKILLEDKTGRDGVLHKKIEDLKSINNLSVFVHQNDNIASNNLSLYGLSFSKGLSPRGYIYTDRPVYQPGEQVHLRGIIRDVVDGSYAVREGDTLKCTINNSRGRTITEKEVTLSKYGTFNETVDIGASALEGKYTIRVTQEKPSRSFTGSFLVEKFKLEKIKLTLDFDREVYFRGEEIKAVFTAAYYYGQPVVDEEIRYTLPDGRELTAKTDRAGKVTALFDTSSYNKGVSLTFKGRLVQENVTVTGGAFLADTGFTAKVTVPRSVSLTGEPVEITVKTQDATGKSVSKELELTILKRDTLEPDPLLTSIPWLTAETVSTWAEKVIKTMPLKTDETGIVRVTYTPAESGQYGYRVKGKDRFGTIVTAQAFSQVSGKDDTIKLRLFADRSHYKVGEPGSLDIHSRLEGPKLSLITYEGEGIIQYQIREVKEGKNRINFKIDHTHFPNFSFSVALMDGNKLENVTLPFTVERELKLKVTPENPWYMPGEEATIKVEVKDHLDKPVEGEFSFALVNEAIFAQYKDTSPDIVTFFQEGTTRETAMRIETSCTFAYFPSTREIELAILEEEERLKASKQPESALMSEDYDYFFDGDMGAGYSAEEEMEDDMSDYKTPSRARKEAATTTGKKLSEKEKAGEEPEPEPGPDRRVETGLEGYWEIFATTDKEGKATLTVPLPQTTSEYRLTVKGCTVDTLVGAAAGSLVVRKIFFADLQVPEVFQEKDSVRITGRVHNLSDYQGQVNLTLTLETENPEDTIRFSPFLEIGPGDTRELIFPAWEIPRAENIKVSLDVKTTKPVSDQEGTLEDGLSIDVPVRPWGLAFSDHKGGKAEGDSTVFLMLPEKKGYETLKMGISIGSSVDQSLINMVLGGIIDPYMYYSYGDEYFPTQEPSDLLALGALLSYMEKREAIEADMIEARRQAQGLVSQLVSYQERNGSWIYGYNESVIEVTCTTYWALVQANKQGIPVDSQVLKDAMTYLKSQYSKVSQNAYGIRAMILHALSKTGDADYTFVNRLYRNRNELSETALAYTALCLHALDRSEMGLEVLSLLDTRSLFTEDDDISHRYWSGKKNITWEKSPVETTAIVLLAYQALRPSAREIEEGINYLLSKNQKYKICPIKARGVVVAALTGYYSDVVEGKNDYTLAIHVNDTLLETLTVKDAPAELDLKVPSDLIRAGENRVFFDLEGRGAYVYSAVLTGFSSDLSHKADFSEPNFDYKRYIHENLTYKGKSMGKSTMEIKELEYGQVALVKFDFDYRTGDRYLILEDTVPSGATVLKETLTGNHKSFRISGGKIYFYFEPEQYISNISYQIAGYIPGSYKVLPPILRDAFNPGEMSCGEEKSLILLAEGEESSEPYVMNKDEFYYLGIALYNDGLFDEALKHLEELYSKDKTYRQKDVIPKLLWIRSLKEHYDARKLVEYFEILKEIYPDLFIPFQKILTIGKAYHDLGEYERAYLVYRATVEASFLKDAPIGGTLEQGGEILGSIDFMTRLWGEYPDSSRVLAALFAMAQELYEKAPKADTLKVSIGSDEGETGKVTEAELLNRAEAILWRFMSVYPRDPLADDAAFSMVNLTLDRKQYNRTVLLCRQYRERFPKSDFFTSFQYMEALAYFSMRMYDEAITAAEVVAEGESEDVNLALYILGQIYHAQQKPGKAVSYYNQVKNTFPDAGEAASYFERKSISLDEVATFRPGDLIKLRLKYRNIENAYLQVYKVDLMKLYLKEKNLSRITGINLSGISPLLEKESSLGTGKDYKDKEKDIILTLYDEGAYLIICRGDDLFTSGLVLITPLEIEVQEYEDSGRLRVNVKDMVRTQYANNVHVKVIGSSNDKFVSGETDLRGVFIADAIMGTPTVIARDLEDRYAFYRGTKSLGAYYDDYYYYDEWLEQKAPAIDYRSNQMEMQRSMQELNRMNLDNLYKEDREGVQIQEAF